jgi:hypothetical protein
VAPFASKEIKMQTATCTTAIGSFATLEQADKAVDALFNAGFDTTQIGIVSRDHAPGTRQVVTTKSSATKSNDEVENAETGATTGAITGAGIGALVGWGVLAGAIPVIGPALFAGTMGVLASNAVGGAAIVGVVGALTGWGVSEEHAKHYETEVSAGRVVVTVTAENRCGEACTILRRFGATIKDNSNCTV